MSDSDKPSDIPDTNIVYIDLPPYCANEPRAWFIQLDVLFECRGITSQRTKFGNVVRQLPPSMVVDLVDILSPIPAVNPYDTLKAAIIKRTAASDEANLRQLLSGIELGDRTPSQLLRHMQHLIGGKAFEQTLLRQLWLQRMPLNMRQILATQEDSPLPALAETADKIHECYPDIHVAAVQQSHPYRSELDDLQTRFDKLELRLDKLTDMLAALRPTSRSSSPTPRHSSRPARSRTRNGICFYHQKFKDSAKHCILPCAYVPQHQGNLPASQ